MHLISPKMRFCQSKGNMRAGNCVGQTREEITLAMIWIANEEDLYWTFTAIYNLLFTFIIECNFIRYNRTLTYLTPQMFIGDYWPPSYLKGSPNYMHVSFHQSLISQFTVNDSFVIANVGNYTIASSALFTTHNNNPLIAHSLYVWWKKWMSAATLYPSIRHYL